MVSTAKKACIIINRYNSRANGWVLTEIFFRQIMNFLFSVCLKNQFLMRIIVDVIFEI